MRYRFGEFELDAASYGVTRAGVALRVWPKVFDVLRYLIEHRERTVTKQELLDTLWSDSHVDEVAVPWTISHARRLLGQQSGEKSPIETLHGRGYRFTADVEVLPDRTSVPPPAIVPPPTPAADPDQALPFVGRAEAMQQLERRLRDAKAGRGGLCLLVGVAGIGKTRCMDELASRAHGQGFAVWSGRSVEDAWAPVFWPWVQVVRQAVRQRPTLAARGEALLARLGVVERAGGDSDDNTDTEATGGDNFWWVDGVSRLLLDAASERPLLLLLDDLHWADAATIDLLTFMAPELRHVPLLAVATQRDGSAAFHTHALKRLSRHVDRIDLGPLSADDVAQYMRLIVEARASGAASAASTDTRAPDAELSIAVHRATAGNPLFLQQTVRGLVSRHGPAALSSLSPASVEPASIARDVLGAALAVLDRDSRDLLCLASVLGESFELSTLQKLADRSMDELLAALERARHEGFLIAEEPISFRFCHALLRTILYDELPAHQRMQQHRRAAHVLERSGLSPRRAEIAHHYYSSLALGDYERVTAAAIQAAKAAARMHAFADALTFCEWAMAAQALDPEVQPRARAELLLFSAQMHANAGQADTSQTMIDALIEIARPRRYFDLLVRAARIRRHTHMMGAIEDPLVRGILEEALEHAPPGPNDLRISALSQLSWVPPYALDIARSKDLSEQAVELAREHGEESVLMRALNARLYALGGPDDIDARLAVADEMLTRNRRLSAWVTAAALGARYGAQIHRGDMAAADATCAELGQVAREQHWPAAIWYQERLVVQRMLLNGELARAATALPELQEHGRRFRVSYAPLLINLLQGLLWLEQQGAQGLGGSVDLTSVRNEVQTALVSVRPSAARLLIELGDASMAKATLDELAANDFSGIPKEINYLNALSNLAVIAVQLGDRARAEALYALLSPYPHFNTPNVMQLYEGSVSFFLGRLAAFLGKDGARRHFDDAMAMNERIGQMPQLARTCQHYAQWLLDQGSRADRSAAKALQARARSLAESCGMRSLT